MIRLDEVKQLTRLRLPERSGPAGSVWLSLGTEHGQSGSVWLSLGTEHGQSGSMSGVRAVSMSAGNVCCREQYVGRRCLLSGAVCRQEASARQSAGSTNGL